METFSMKIVFTIGKCKRLVSRHFLHADRTSSIFRDVVVFDMFYAISRPSFILTTTFDLISKFIDDVL